MQSTTEKIVKSWSYNSLNISQIAVLGCDRYGGIEVMQGGIDFYKSQLNRTYQTKRQMGSVFKPLVYLTAMEKGYTPYSLIDDSPISFGSYTPMNYNKDYNGVMTFANALAKSNNIATIKIQERVGRSNIVKNASLFGIKAEPYISMALGVNEASLYNLVAMYNTFGNLGKKTNLYGIERITDKHGNTIYQHKHKVVRLLSEDNVKPLDEMLKAVVDYGTGRIANLGQMVAGKTGTTSDYRDAWFVGFTTNATYGVWCGNDNNSPMNKVTGGVVPARIWKNVMKYH
jgi:penicillin-binding protein 1A